MQVVRLVQGGRPVVLETRVEPETLPAMASLVIWKASVVLVALLALVVPTPRVTLAALLARVVLVPPTIRVAWLPRVALETRKPWEQQPLMLPLWHGHSMFLGQVAMQYPWLPDRKTKRRSCILSEDALRPSQPLRYKEARGTGKFSCRWCLNPVSLSKLTVPFRCSLEAEMARITMDDGEEQNPQQTTVQREIKIKGTVLSVKWIADDFDLLRVSVGSFLEKLSVVMQNIQCIWPFIPRRVNRARRPGAEPGDPN
ncbi:hypothetical protein QTO34_000159 [Cnephaeus nilssonii]|uniref:L antigen family member 3 n=1 Tax=Cnephaeus nilssonii TaxID=3371016 RepID=A0AA40LUE6_CNENI|nr:hypothetical protein QTO34_000159 [Eptesicus nilssonii]